MAEGKPAYAQINRKMLAATQKHLEDMRTLVFKK